ncbi:MAG: hypothetical protein IPN79_00070 [Saprospiraceae bacterium]|nr:hypothetical protein [Saprospiraceae bacterium]
MDIFIDLVKSTVPALVVFFTVYYLFKTFMKYQWQMAALENQKQKTDQVLPLKLQAYERLALFCERISIDTLLYRINHHDMSGVELRSSLMIAIQQEFEHNLTQQIYVSENLWKIIKLTKDQWQKIISETEGQENNEFVRNLYARINSLNPSPLDYAKLAIKKETEVLLS